MCALVLSVSVPDVEWEAFLLITETSSASVTKSHPQLEIRYHHTRSGKRLLVVVHHKDHCGFLVLGVFFSPRNQQSMLTANLHREPITRNCSKSEMLSLSIWQAADCMPDTSTVAPFCATLHLIQFYR